ncbi:potassium channel SKOR-like isoform X2 [Tripterygium wilfordii]|uniref:potassium channel SKOR-like isoform X2 n=1 Tax=Tripterygium wilfordii TaxID=458696 RepID=UPI0018F818AB|nr:potassium channel SKOR-like isoform X2 [Tripterygium wilfordii]
MRGERRETRSEEEEEEESYQEVRDSSKSSRRSRLGLLRNDYSESDFIVSRSNSTGPSSSSHGFVIRPHKRWYMLWVHFILIWAVYSSFFTPLEFGFFRGLPEDLFLLDIAGQIAFLVDIVVHFFVAYRDTSSYRMVYNRNLIALRYLKSRFLIDFLGCLPWDAIFKACGRKEPVRYMLWIRLSRALRVTEFFERLEKNIKINYLFTRIVKLLVVELYCTHTAACIFYYLATTIPPSKEGYTWIGSLQMGDFHYTDFREIDLWKRYVTSLYFAIVTMATVGYGEIHAVNIREMIFVMVYVSFDMILGAYLVGNMTALIVKGSKTEKFRDKMDDLIKYMNRNNLERNITNAIKDHLLLQYDRGYTEAAILQDIPASIRTKAIKVDEEFFLPGEVIVEQGNMVDQLYIVCHGELEEVGKEENNEIEKILMRLQTNSSFGEISFLCNTPQPYTVRVRELCRVLRLDKQSFIEILATYFSDGRIILDNLVEGKDSVLRNEILESDVNLYVAKHESEQAMRLNCAIYHGDLYQLKRLIDAGADPNKGDYDGRSPLHIAALKGYEDIALFLIEQRVEINVSDKFGNTPLLEAIKNEHDEVASLLVKAGASLKIDDDGGFLCTTVARGDLDLLKRVLANGLDPNVKNYDSRTPLHIAASEGFYLAANLLLEFGATILLKDRWGNTPLDEARISGNKSLIKLLEDAKISQTSEFSVLPHQIEDETRRKCTVFPFHPWDTKERREGVVLWVPQTIEELVEAAMEQLQCSSCCVILSEDGGKIVDMQMIKDEQKLFLVGKA